MRLIVFHDLYGSVIFFHIVSQTSRFWKKVMEHKMCVLILSTSVWNISHSKRQWAMWDSELKWKQNVHRSLLLFLSDFNGNFNFLDSFSKILKFYENSSSASRVVPCGRTDMTKLIVAFRNFAKAYTNSTFCVDYQIPSSDNRVGMKISPSLEGYCALLYFKTNTA